MADVVTKQELEAAKIDVKHAGEAVNTKKVITPRYGAAFKSLPLVSAEAQAKADEIVAQGFYKGYATEALLLAAKPTVSEMRARADDTRKIYRWNRTSAEGITPVTGTWTDTGLSDFDQARNYADVTKLDNNEIMYGYKDGNQIGAKSKRKSGFGINGSYVASAYTQYDCVVIPVDAGDVLYMYNTTGIFTAGSYYAFFAQDPIQNPSQTHIASTFTLIKTPFNHREVKVPDGAKYLILNTRFSSTQIDWAVHKGAFSDSYASGKEHIQEIKGVRLTVEDTPLDSIIKQSTKNLFSGEILKNVRIGSAGVIASTSTDDAVTQFVPVQNGETYTISGLSFDNIRVNFQVWGVENNDVPTTGFSSRLALTQTETITVTIDNLLIKYLVVQVSEDGYGTLDTANKLPIQVEKGGVATQYEPSHYTDTLLRLKGSITKKSSVSQLTALNQYVEINKKRDATSAMEAISKDFGALGIDYILSGDSNTEHTTNSLYASFTSDGESTKEVYVNVQKFVENVKTSKSVERTLFNVPSGVLDNPNAFPLASTFPRDTYAHPSIKYTDTAIAGFKYWMINSCYPPGASLGGVLWEDEDLFVSNDGKSWQRVRSMYETDKSYTTATLRLPPHNLVKGVSRENAFLPVPARYDTFEISVPSSGGQPALDRVQVQLDLSGSWKHDPHLYIEGGYVYVYHTFNLKASALGGDTSRFLVLVRTSNGVDWDVVRTDGSTMRITEETSRQLFTKDSSGRYNYLNYQYGGSRGNPELIKFSEGDYELFYGYNFSGKYVGTSPWSFDWDNFVPVQSIAATNHPSLFLNNGTLYLLTNAGLYSSTNRGTTWTIFNSYPMWFGGVNGESYKKSCCVGDGGKFIVADVQVIDANASALDSMYPARMYSTSFYEYSSFAEYLNFATSGYTDAYVDVLLVTTDMVAGTRKVKFVPYISSTSRTIGNNRTLDTIKIADVDLKPSETLHAYVTLNARRNAQIKFGGIHLR